MVAGAVCVDAARDGRAGIIAGASCMALNRLCRGLDVVPLRDVIGDYSATITTIQGTLPLYRADPGTLHLLRHRLATN